MWSHLLIVLSSWLIIVLFRKSFPGPKSSRLSITFSSLSFSVSGLMWWALILLEFSSVQMISMDLFVIFYKLLRRFDQHHLFKMLAFFWCVFLASLFQNQASKYVWVYIWVFNKGQIIVRKIHVSVFMTVPCSFYYYRSVVQPEIIDSDTFRSPIIVWDCFSYFVFFFCFPYEVLFLQSL